MKQYSKMMPIVVLLATEAELYSAVLMAQEMMIFYHVMLGMELQMQLPMILFCNHKEAVVLANNRLLRFETVYGVTSENLNY